MTEEKRDELVRNFYSKSGFVPTEWAVINFKAGFDQGYQLAQAEIEKLKSDLKDYYFTQEKYKESYEYGLKLKDEIKGVREQLQAQCKITHELLDEKALLNHQLIKINQEVATLVEALKYFTGWSRAEQALSEWNKKRGGV